MVQGWARGPDGVGVVAAPLQPDLVAGLGDHTRPGAGAKVAVAAVRRVLELVRVETAVPGFEPRRDQAVLSLGGQAADRAEVPDHKVLGRVTVGGLEEDDLLVRRGPALERVQEEAGAELLRVQVLAGRTAASGGRAATQRANRTKATAGQRERGGTGRDLCLKGHSGSSHGTTTVLLARIKGDHPSRHQLFAHRFLRCVLAPAGEWLRPDGSAEISPGRRRRARRERGTPGTGGARSDRAQNGQRRRVQRDVTRAKRFRYKRRSRGIGGIARVAHWSLSLLCRARF